ncbi:hypothetical protein ACE2AJ_17935 [Aquihabitans daechungensis]|uniref:hypothetical protein n=1 Tax=Aquihabitans daechungensis TaxID=1052257 RepID=UPI003B9DCA34
MRPVRRLRRTVLVAVASATLLASCSGSSTGSEPSGDTTADGAVTTTAAPQRHEAKVTTEAEVDGNYRQGLARSGDGWIFVTNNAIYRTDASFVQTDALHDAIPPDLAAQGYDHLGDPDVSEGLIWVPVERADKDSGKQVTARYDEETFEFVDSVEVEQHHNAFIGVGEDGTAYSADEFSDDVIVRYRITDGEVVPQEPLELSRTVERIQGGDVIDGALWLSTDDDHNGVYRVDLVTGEVQDLGSAGHIEGEGEGIDATELDGSTLHVLVADAAIVPMYVTDLRVTASS